MNAAAPRLGRGLGSLIAGGGAVSSIRANDPPSSPSPGSEDPPALPAPVSSLPGDNRLIEVPVDQVVPNRRQPRKVIDPQAVSELAASIASEGLLQPIVIRPTGDGYELIAGERRLRAHQHLGRSVILARIIEATDVSSASLSLIENLQREQLNPLEEALGYQCLVSDFNLTQQEVADRMGKSRAHVTNLLRLLQLDDELRRLVADSELSVGHAKVLLGVDDVELRTSLGRRAALEGWTVRQVEDAVSSPLASEPGSIRRTHEFTSSAYRKLARELRKSMGRKVKIKSNPRGEGLLTLSFGDEEDLLSLVSRLTD